MVESEEAGWSQPPQTGFCLSSGGPELRNPVLLWLDRTQNTCVGPESMLTSDPANRGILIISARIVVLCIIQDDSRGPIQKICPISVGRHSMDEISPSPNGPRWPKVLLLAWPRPPNKANDHLDRPDASASGPDDVRDDDCLVAARLADSGRSRRHGETLTWIHREKGEEPLSDQVPV